MKTFPYPTTREQIPDSIKCVSRVKSYATQEVRMIYQCPDDCWKDHQEAWMRARESMRKQGIDPSNALEPFPYGHVSFSASPWWLPVPKLQLSDIEAR